jgi:hypothetical protein
MHENHETSPEQDAPATVWAPLCRELGLALITARSERFADWDVDRVVTVAPHS